MITIEDLKKELDLIKDKPKFPKMLDFASILTSFFEQENIKPIVVGGLSVEIYTRNDYTTHDIDFVCSGWHRFDEVLSEIGFTRTEREWYHTEAELAIEIRDDYLDGNYDKFIELQLPNSRKLYVIGIEDIIIHRLEGIFHENPENDVDYEWAMRMFLIHKEDNIDMDYLINEARKTKTYHILEKWLDLD